MKQATCHSDRPSVAYGLCKACYKKVEYLRNREKILKANRERRWFKRFGITAEEYAQLLKKQKGRCAICRTKPTNVRLAVDHNHKTKIVRGLLCGKCNMALGLLNDNTKILEKAIEYLIRENK